MQYVPAVCYPVRMFRMIPILIAVLMAAPPSFAASLQELVNMQKGADAMEQQLSIDPVDVEQLSLTVAEVSDHSLFPLPYTATGSQRPAGGLQNTSLSYLVVDIGSQHLELRDVPRDSWFAPYVRAAAELGIISGYRNPDGSPTGEFKPENPVTIEEVAKMAVTSAAIDAQSCPVSKNITASGSWSASYIGCAEQRQWGVFGDGTVDVKRPATRAEVVFTILQAMGAQGAAMTGSGWTTGFSDVPSSMPFAIAIARAKQDNIISGYAGDDGVPTGIFGPQDPVKRAEIAKITALAIQVYAGP